MPRSKNKVASRARRKKILKMAKGNWGARKNVYTIAKNTVEKGLLHARKGRKLKKRVYRNLWIIRINAAAHQHNTTYSKLIHALNVKGVDINRKILASIAVENPKVFADIIAFVQN
jgi:large subunit ribosomal protein L20